MRNRNITTLRGVCIIAAIVLIGSFWCFFQYKEFLQEIASYDTYGQNDENDAVILAERAKILEERRVFMEHTALFPSAPLTPPDLSRMKWQGCVTDGLLSGYSSEVENVELINRLPCYYLHRAVETWLNPPQWGMITDLQKEITRSPIVYGMFIAEAINTKSQYWDAERKTWFSFSKMCKEGSNGQWGQHSCVPSFERKEYRAYATQVMKDAIDHNIQVFLIGQVYMQDARRLENSDIEDVLTDVRTYAHQKNTDILIGAQTNNITDKDYLQLFDFIEGGTGLHPDGSIEDGACFSQWTTWCWALLWNENYRNKAHDVLIHLDWRGAEDDDMSIFVRMPREQRAATLKNLHATFQKKGVGFLLPVLTALPNNHTGCHGNREHFYSADKKYSCNDESVIKDILTKSI